MNFVFLKTTSMGKVQEEAYYLHEGFKKFVLKDNLAYYENDFYERNKIYTVKFVKQHIEKYVDLKYHHKKITDENDIALFNFFLYNFSKRYSKYNLAMKNYKKS